MFFFSTSVYALTISPVKIEMTVDPGKTVHGEIELFNEQDEIKNFYTSYENFESHGDSGAPYFIGKKDGLATWITTDPSVTIGSGERILVPYTISVPSNAKPGGYFAAIFFGSKSPESVEGGEVSIGGKIGILILLRVAGDVEESAGLIDFKTKNEVRFFSTLPVSFEYGFNNTGGDRVVPRGEIKIKNMFRFTSAEFPANENIGSVLPNSTRRFESSWKERTDESRNFFETLILQIKDFHFGWYSAYMNITWGESAQSIGASYNFFIIPWQLLSVVVSLVVLGWFLFKLWINNLKRRIIAEMAKNK